MIVAGSTARIAVSLVSVNKTTPSYYFHRLRLLLYENNQEPDLLEGETEVDESSSGSRRKGEGGRGAGNKAPVFGLLKRNRIVYTDSFRSYNALDVSEFTHYRINYSKEFAQDRNHINGIEKFWSQAKRNTHKYNGIPKEHFHLFLK